MDLIQNSALWRALSACVNFAHHLKTPRDIQGTAPPPLSAHIARDIGLSPGEQERMRHRWPSQSTQHPYL